MTDALPAPTRPAEPERLGSRLERFLVAFLLLAMILLPAASTLSRRLIGRELPGSAILAQHITLWVGFLGALLATVSGHHLALSTLEAGAGERLVGAGIGGVGGGRGHGRLD